MEEERLRQLLKDVADGRITPQEAAERLKTLPYNDLGFANVDTHRQLRQGRAEVVFGIGKTPEQVAGIMKRLSETAPLVIATKATEAHAAAAGAACGTEVRRGEVAAFLSAEAVGAIDTGERPTGGLTYYEVPRMLVWRAENAAVRDGKGLVAVVCAGTADIPIAEEAALTAALYNCRISRFTDVGVAGIHRLLDRVEEIRKADAVVAVAGMEGALASVVGGLVAAPVIAVPTSIGYGASLGGLAALFAMLNSCSLGVSVMNIDNGFGAGYLASLIALKE